MIFWGTSHRRIQCCHQFIWKPPMSINGSAAFHLRPWQWDTVRLPRRWWLCQFRRTLERETCRRKHLHSIQSSEASRLVEEPKFALSCRLGLWRRIYAWTKETEMTRRFSQISFEDENAVGEPEVEELRLAARCRATTPPPGREMVGWYYFKRARTKNPIQILSV